MVFSTEKILRKLNTQEKIFRNSKRVQVVSAVDCIMALSKCNLNPQAVKDEIQKMLNEYKLVRIKMHEKDSQRVDIAISNTINPNDFYMWTEDKVDYQSMVVALSVVAFLFFLSMFRIWPFWLRSKLGYIKYLLGGLLCVILLITILRLIIFSITYFTHYPGLWIFPNINEDCGPIESFKPLYSWGNENVAPKKSID